MTGISIKRRMPWKDILKDDLNKFYLSIGVFFVAQAMVTIFVPMYLYRLGYSITSILFYYFMMLATHLAFSLFAAKIALRIGNKAANLVSMPFLIAYYCLLSGIDVHPWLYWILPLLNGLNSALYWFSFHHFFTSLSKKESRGVSFGTAQVFMSGTALLGPIIGALILTWSGMTILLIVVSVLLVVSCVPLFFIKRCSSGEDLHFVRIFAGFPKRKFLAYFGYGFQAFTDNYLWVIFAFLIIKEYLTVGVLSTIIQLAAIIATLAVGHFSDKSPKAALMRVGATIMSLIWAVRGFMVSVWGLFVSSFIFRIAYVIVDIPFSARYYDLGKDGNVAKNILRREYGLHSGTLSAFAFLFMLFTFSHDTGLNFIIAFIAAGLLNLLVFLY